MLQSQAAPSASQVPLPVPEGLEKLGIPVHPAEATAQLQQAPPADQSTALAAPQPQTEATTVAPTQGAYSSREEFLEEREAAGEISFKYIRNDGSQQNNIWLIGLKNIFSKQLPNMPKEYITRLVMDRRHRSVGIVKGSDNGPILGGITYRTFQGKGLAEIAFCAITATEQVKGYGTRLMNYTKEFAKTKDGITHFLTYADNNAVGYFMKQGFTKEITLPHEQWSGYIKDYDGGTLMEAVIHPGLGHTQFAGMIKRQRAALDDKIKEQSNSHIVYPGLKIISPEGVREPVDIQSIPGVKDAGWSCTADTPTFILIIGGQACPPTSENLYIFMKQAHMEIKQHEDSWPFLEAVDANDVPDYYEVVKNPVDLALIQSRLESRRYYLTLEIFIADFRWMFENCRTYNAADTIYYKLASKLEAIFEHLLNRSVITDRSEMYPM